jgi:hypothetical protein
MHAVCFEITIVPARRERKNLLTLDRRRHKL